MDFDIAAIDFTSSLLNVCIGNINKAGQIQSKVNMSVKCNGINKGVVQDIDAVSSSLSYAIKKIKSEYGIGIKSAFINVPCYMCKISHNSVTENVYNKEVDTECMQSIKNKLLSVQKHENFVVTDIALTKFVMDSNMEVRNPYGKFANLLSATTNIVSLNSEYFKILTVLFENIGLQMDGIIMNTLSGLSLLPFSDSERSNVVIINISWEITDITVCQFGKIVYTDTIFAGVRNIIKDVSIGLNIGLEDAERMLKNYPVADTQYIKSDLENTLKMPDGKTVTFLLSEMISFVKDRVLDIYEICAERLAEKGIIVTEDYKICIYGADIEKYAGYADLAQKTFGMRIKKIPYALFEVEDILYGTGSGMIRYISHHPLLKKESNLNVKVENKSRNKESILKKFIRFLKID